MILISHRGNIDGCDESKENSPSYIDDAIKLGFDVEVDVWNLYGDLYLGHDSPQYKIELEWLINRKNNLWIHTKNYKSMCSIVDTELRFFFHEKESHTIIYNTKLFWSHNLNEAGIKSIIPLLSKNDIENFDGKKVFGICSDFVKFFKK